MYIKPSSSILLPFNYHKHIAYNAGFSPGTTNWPLNKAYFYYSQRFPVILYPKQDRRSKTSNRNKRTHRFIKIVQYLNNYIARKCQQCDEHANLYTVDWLPDGLRFHQGEPEHRAQLFKSVLAEKSNIILKPIRSNDLRHGKAFHPMAWALLSVARMSSVNAAHYSFKYNTHAKKNCYNLEYYIPL